MKMSWNSVGSAPFALTVLAVLGLGGGFLLAFLPFNSAERTATSPRRSLPDFQTLPMQDATPAAEPGPDAQDTSRAESVRTIHASGDVRAVVALKIESAEGDYALPDAISKSSDETSFADAVGNAALNFPAGSEHFLTDIPSAHTSVGSYEAQQTAVIPEPSTWTFLLLGIPLCAFAQLLRRRLVR